MIKSLDVINYLGESVSIELGNPGKTGFLIREITGLGPGKASIISTELPTTDGSMYNSARLETRYINISMLFEGTNVEEIRHKTYKYFPIKKKLKLVFHTDERECSIEGYVESNEPAIFSKQEGTMIVVKCPKPYFYSLDRNISEFYSVEGGFEFPFSNESLTEPMIEFGNISADIDKVIYYNGDAEIGMYINLHCIGPVSGITLYNVDTNEIMRIDSTKVQALTGSDFTKGDDIEISTVSREKHIYLLRDGKRTNILNALDKNADWFKLRKGVNVFAYTAEVGSGDLQLRFENQIIYEGV